jgi:hypothetical protein
MSQVEKISSLRKGTRRAVDGLRVRMIVREDGGARFDSEVLPDGRDETVVIAQIRGESPADAVTRALSRISSLERTGRTIESAVILAAPFHDAERSASRVLIMRALLSHMASSRQGELLISAEEVDDSVLGDLSELTRSLADEYARTGVDVQLRVRPPRSSPVAIGLDDASELSDGAAA